MTMPNRAPIIVTTNRTAAHWTVACASPGTIPSSTARPTIQGPAIAGSCQNMPKAVVVRMTGHWIPSVQSRNRNGVRVSGAAVALPPLRA